MTAWAHQYINYLACPQDRRLGFLPFLICSVRFFGEVTAHTSPEN